MLANNGAKTWEFNLDEIKRKQNEIKMRTQQRTNILKLLSSKGLGYIVLIFYSFVSFWPFIWSLMVSFKDPYLITITGLNPFPKSGQWTMINYENLFYNGSASPFINAWLGNTIVYSFLSSLLNATLNLLGGYALAQIAMKGKRIIISYFLASITVPSQATFIPTYFMYSHLGIISDAVSPNFFIFAMVMSGATNIILTFMARQFFLTQTAEMEEASKIEGYGPWGIFLKITLRKMLPLFATQFVLVFMGSWNNFLTFQLFSNGTPEKMTINPGIVVIASTYIDKEIGYGVMFAMSNISFIPMFILYGISLRIQLRGIRGGNK